MILYNVTVSVDDEIQHEWIQWMKDSHIPDVMRTGMFSGHKFLRLLNEDTPNPGTTYAVQYYCKSLSHLEKYLQEFAPPLQKEHSNKYNGKFVAFRTFLEEI